MFQPTMAYFMEVVINVGAVMATYIRNLQIKAQIQVLNKSRDKIFVTWKGLHVLHVFICIVILLSLKYKDKSQSKLIILLFRVCPGANMSVHDAVDNWILSCGQQRDKP